MATTKKQKTLREVLDEVTARPALAPLTESTGDFICETFGERYGGFRAIVEALAEARGLPQPVISTKLPLELLGRAATLWCDLGQPGADLHAIHRKEREAAALDRQVAAG